MDFQVFVTPGLGDNSYLIASGGEAVVIDPQRDAWRFLAFAEAQRWRVRHVVETHVHNDYVSGAHEIRKATGAEICGPARAGYRFAFHRLEEGSELRVGCVRLVAWEAPGHTWEHMCYLVHEDGAGSPALACTGGSLIVGSTGRTDLLGPEHTDALTRAQYRTVRRLAELADAVQVLPTHGAGSFCTAAVGRRERTTTIGEERRTNPALAAPDEAAFVKERLTGLLAYPAYYAHMAGINLRGAPVLESLPRVDPLTPDDLEQATARGAWVVDARSRYRFAEAHVPGSVNVELDSMFGTYVGWTIPFGAPLVLLLPEPVGASAEQAMTQLIRIGWDGVAGFLAGGIDAWRRQGRPARGYPTVDVDDLCHAFLEGRDIEVLDVRQPSEWETGHVPGSRNIFVGELPGRVREVRGDREVWVACASGHRAAIAASVLDRAGANVRLVAQGGVPEWLARCMPRAR